MTAWSSLASMPTARQKLAAASDTSGRIYAIGGLALNGSDYVSAVERFDPATGAWSTLAPLPTPRQGLTAATSAGLIYAIGGSGSGGARSTVERFDPATGTWSTLTAMPTARWELGSAADSSGRIYAIGGTNANGNTLSTVERFDPATGAWSTLAPLPTLRRRLAAASDTSGRIYAIGGDNLGVRADVTRFDPATGAWTTLTSMPTARSEVAGAADSSGRIYAIGGVTNAPTTLSTVERFDPGTGAWTSLASMPTARQRLGAAASGSLIYAIGGLDANGSGYASSVVERDTENTAPYAPTLNGPANNATIDLSVTQRFSWTSSDPDPGDTQSKFDLQYRVVGAPSWTAVTGTTPNTFYDFAAATFTANNYEWQTRTYDSQGLVGPYSGSSFFTAGNAPATPTITAPVNGSTVVNTATLTWSNTNQADYQYRRVADNAGAPDTTTVYFDTGDVVDASTRSQTVTFDVNNRWEHLQVRIKNAGLWSAWADCRVQVSYTAPMVPSMYLSADNAGATIAITVINPTPGAGVPAVVYNDVYISSPVDPEYRAATMVPPNATWIWYLPASGRVYTVRIVAVGTNATTTSS